MSIENLSYKARMEYYATKKRIQLEPPPKSIRIDLGEQRREKNITAEKGNTPRSSAGVFNA